MKYLKGQIVLIKEWDDMVNEYGMNDNGDILIPNFHFIKSMKKFCGMPVVIIKCDEDKNCYSILEDLTDCAFTDEMIEGKFDNPFAAINEIQEQFGGTDL